jgi:N-methylhydantoinase A
MPERTYRLGCDIGGTFTDFVLLDDRTGELHIHKCLTTPQDPSDAVEQGIQALAARLDGMVDRLDEVIHGTTLVINSIIERKGARTGLITTRGFRDVLELGREIRYAPYDVFAEFPEPLVPRRLRLEVDERVRSDGTVLQPLDPALARDVVRKLLDLGVDSLAVCLLNSFENPAHEKLLKQIIQQEAPQVSVSISFDVLPQIREYERTSTTVTNAYVKPLTGRYLTRLAQRLFDRVAAAGEDLAVNRTTGAREGNVGVGLESPQRLGNLQAGVQVAPRAAAGQQNAMPRYTQHGIILRSGRRAPTVKSGSRPTRVHLVR